MRFFRRIYNFITLTLAVALSLACCLGIKARCSFRLSALSGERAYYLYSCSSQALIKKELTLLEVFHIRGESVETTSWQGGKKAALELIESYGGRVLLQEECQGVTSYYAYVPEWGAGVSVCGYRINLHVAIEENRCVVGTPIIFGGY